MRHQPFGASNRASVLKLAIIFFVVVLWLSAVTLTGGSVGAQSLANVPRRVATIPPATWTTYHHDNQRSGYDAQQPAFTGTIAPAWASPAAVDGAVYAEPLVSGNTVIVATENNSVYALNAGTGAILWHANLGPPVPGSSLPCGNISTVGITSTPVVDATAGVVYVVALVQPSGQAMRHVFAALNLSTGAVRFQQTVSVSGIDPQHHLQRGALTLLNGTVYVPFGGNYGDCTPYHGWLVGMPTSGSGSPTVFQTSMNYAGGLWQPAGASVDASGNLYETSGNTVCGSPCTYDGGETVFKLSPALQELDYFAPSNFATLDANDLDLGSTDPLPVNGGLIFQVGKTGDGFLLHQSGLGHVGGQAYTAHVCPNLTDDAAFGGGAYVDPYIYVPCNNGLVALTLNSAAPSFSFAWQGPSVSYAGPPIVAGGLVWTLDPAGTLYALNPTTGATIYSYHVGSAAHFATPSAGAGYVFAAGSSKVYAFQSTSSTPTPSPTATATATPSGTPPPGSVSLIGTASAHGNFGSGVSLTVPTAVQAGDLLLAVAGSNGTPASWTPPAGWTVGANGGNPETEGLTWWWRLASSADAGTTVTLKASSFADGGGVVLAYRGLAASPIEAVSVLTSNNNGGAGHVASATCASASWSSAASVVSLLLLSWQPTTATLSWPSGYAQQASATDSYSFVAVGANLTAQTTSSLASQSVAFSATQALIPALQLALVLG